MVASCSRSIADLDVVKAALGAALVRLMVALVALGAAGFATAQDRDYVLGPGDLVRIIVFQNPDLTTETRVSETGSITFPLIGAVDAAGQSASALERAIIQKLRDGGFVNRPQVNVNVVQFKSIQVSVLGQVNRPGRFPLDQAKNRLSEVLALAGGILPTGADIITLITNENGQDKKIEIDVPGMIQSGDLARDVMLRNGDVIYVPRAPLFYIYGEVQRPGQFRIERDMTVIQALATGGGLTIRGTMRGMKLSRRTPAGTVVTRDANPNEHVFPDDVIYVKESIF
jgi:polysaccharide biosynthesis/export protein